MAFRSKTVTISTTPVAIVDASKSIDGAKGSFTNIGSISCWIGGDDMTSANATTAGVEVSPGGGVDDIELVSGEVAYLVTVGGSTIVAAAASGVS